MLHEVLDVSDRSYFSLIKKRVHALAVECKFSEHRTGETDIVISELLTNLIKHAGGGKLYLKRISQDGLEGFEIIALDNGPGMQDFTRMVYDGSSSKNTLGLGLGSITRIATEFRVFSNMAWGTVMLIRLFPERESARRSSPDGEIRSIVCPKNGEIACGDGFFWDRTDRYVRLFLGDGLGHGPEAEIAVKTAGRSFSQIDSPDPVEIIRTMHQDVKRTRGLVGTIAVFDREAQTWRFCGVGNITFKMYSAGLSKNLLPYNGIIGLNIPSSLNEQRIPFEKGQIVVGWSDGLKSRADILRYPALLRSDLSLLCGTLIKEYARDTDDMSVVACKIN